VIILLLLFLGELALRPENLMSNIQSKRSEQMITAAFHSNFKCAWKRHRERERNTNRRQREKHTEEREREMHCYKLT
jgi:hypothetical protein